MGKEMQSAARLSCFMLMAALVLGCKSQSTEKRGEMVGGCEFDTIRLGLSMERARPDTVVPFRLAIRSVRDAGAGIYSAAAADFTALLDSLGVTVFRRSDLVHLSQGACWPPYFIDFQVGLRDRAEAGRLHSALMKHPVAGILPSPERPEGYGMFFITASSGSSDLWTAWYDSAR